MIKIKNLLYLIYKMCSMSAVIKKLLHCFKSPVRAYNDAGERIESMRFSVPALRVGVLEYGPGELQTGNAVLDGKLIKLYYPPEAVSDEKFLKSLETAPVVIGGHGSTTNEQNKKIDGWAHNVSFDAAAKAAMIAGVVKGAKEIAYVKGNLGSAGFGASAFVDIYNLIIGNGVTPDGQEYNAIANDLRATHVTLAPHVRDPENKIKVINAVCVNVEGATMTEEKLEKRAEMMNTINIDPVAFAAAVKNVVRRVTVKNKFYSKQSIRDSYKARHVRRSGDPEHDELVTAFHRYEKDSAETLEQYIDRLYNILN
jgi:hypothetical protein